MGKTSIEWTDHSWPIVNGCRRISPGCGRKAGEGGCYAERLISTRLSKTPKYRGLAVFTENGPRWTGESRLWAPHLDMPLRLKKPSKIFVADMGDLFFEKVTNEEIAAVFGVMAAAPRHTFQVLTKRPERMLEWFQWVESHAPLRNRTLQNAMYAALESEGRFSPTSEMLKATGADVAWPLPNVWLGVSVENQKYADERIPLLLKAPAAVRFISAEPLLGPVDFSRFLEIGGACECIDSTPRRDRCEGKGPRGWVRCNAGTRRVDQIIVGGESGPGAGPMHPGWVRLIRDQCNSAGVAFFFKQWGQWAPGARYVHGERGPWDHYINPDGSTGECAISPMDQETYSNWTGDPEAGHAVIQSIGKKKAGRLLDGRTWDEFPAVRA